ncbi:MAG: hypothetical protein ACI8X5_002153 [Planctomycetota bacterium]|jgi:hypothetical protein
MNKNHILAMGVVVVFAFVGYIITSGGSGSFAAALEEGNQTTLTGLEREDLPTARVSEPVELPQSAAAGIAEPERKAIMLARPKDIAPEFRYRARVLDHEGNPVIGIGVSLQSVKGSITSHEQGAFTSGEDGIATFAYNEGLDLVRGESFLMFKVNALSAKPLTFPIDPEVGTSEIATLQLPAMGQVVVSAFDENWEPLADDLARVKLTHIPEGEIRVPSPFDNTYRASVEKSVVGGKATFDNVEAGLEFSAGVDRLRSRIYSHGFTRGPGRAGEVVEIRVQVGADHPILRMRALDESGRPIVNTALKMDLDEESSFSFGGRMYRSRTDSEGIFVLDVAKLESDASLSLVFNLEDESGRSASMDVDSELSVGLNELGDLTFAPQILVKGRCVDQRGEVLGSVKLALRSHRNGSNGTDRDYNFNLTAGEDGQFEIVETLSGSSFELAGKKEGYCCDWQRFELGQEDFKLVLKGAGQIAGCVLIDDGVPMKLIRISVDQESLNREFLGWGALRVQPYEDGTFLVSSLTSSTRLVSVGIENQSNTLATIPDVVVRAGEISRDPRLALIDLRGKLFVQHLKLVTGTPGERISGKINFAAPGSVALDKVHWLRSSDFNLLTDTEVVDMEVKAEGYRTEMIYGTSGELTVQLRRAMSVTLRLTGGAEIPEPPLYIKAVLRPVEGDSGHADHKGSAFDENREIPVSVGQVGRMRVYWQLSKLMGSGAIAMQASTEREQFIEIEDVAIGQIFDIELSQEELDGMFEGFNF